MKKLFKGAIPTIALLLVAVMSLSSVTYAWFTAGDVATVEAVDVDVKSVDGLLVSANGYNNTWGSSMIPTTKGTSAALQDVSTSFALIQDPTSGAATGRNILQFYNVDYDSTFDAITKATKAEGISGTNYSNWMEFDVYIKNEGSDAMTVSLEGSTITGEALSRAVTRVALVQQGTSSASAKVNESTEPTITYGAKLIGVWEPNSTEHTKEGQSWLTNNAVADADLSKKQSYMSVAGEFNTDSSAKTYVNVATGDKYTLVGSNLTLGTIKTGSGDEHDYYSDECLPKDGTSSYYIYKAAEDTAKGEHFTELTLDSFFKTVETASITDSNNTLIDGKEAYLKNGSNYEKVKDTDTIDITKTYYQSATVGTTGANVLAYGKIGASSAAVLQTIRVEKGDTADNYFTDDDAKDIQFEIPGNTIVKYTFFVWVEGQDCDCTNYVSGNPFTLSVQFKKVTQQE